MSKSELLDPAVAALLDGIDSYYVQQRIRWGEAITQGCFEQKNIYDIFEKETMKKILVVREESEDCNRCCCKPDHSLFALFYLVDEAGQEVGNPVMTMEREGCDCCCTGPCPKPCLCCFACNPGCSHQASLHSGDLFGEGAKPGETKGRRDKTNLLGETVQPKGGGGFKPVLEIMDRGDEAGTTNPSTKVFAAMTGPRCFGGCSEFCFSSNFGIAKVQDEEILGNIHDQPSDYASIEKIRPKNFQQAMREAFTDADLYSVDFKESGVSARKKALVLSSMVLTDYMFFDRDNDMCRSDGNTTTITFFNCFCYGCICPCQFSCSSDSSS